MPKPLIVNIFGVDGVGIKTACERIARNLNARGINTIIIHLEKIPQVMEFEDNFYLGKYRGVEVILINRHPYTHSAVRRRLRLPLWQHNSIKPHLSVLITCRADTFKMFHQGFSKKLLANSISLIDLYGLLGRLHCGTKKLTTISTDGSNGRLFAAGKIKYLILKELNNE